MQPGKGGVRFTGDPVLANRVLGIPSRIYQRVARFRAHSFAELEAGVVAVDWSPYGGLTPKAAARASRLYHTKAIEERVAALVPPGETDLLVRVQNNKVSLSVDTSGEALHRRGWRLETGPAPIRETLAAAALALAEWAPGEALVDPMCGSGTFLIEAGIQAAGRWPGAGRSFRCEAWWPDSALPERAAVETLIVGSDRAEPSVGAAKRNAERAGVALDLSQRDVSAVEAPAERGLLICNPPYGKRAGRSAKAWVALGKALKGPFAGWRAAIICPHRRFETHITREGMQRHRLRNGGLAVELLVLPASI